MSDQLDLTTAITMTTMIMVTGTSRRAVLRSSGLAALTGGGGILPPARRRVTTAAPPSSSVPTARSRDARHRRRPSTGPPPRASPPVGVPDREQSASVGRPGGRRRQGPQRGHLRGPGRRRRDLGRRRQSWSPSRPRATSRRSADLHPQGCTVAAVADGTINCDCHGSAFSIKDGSVVTRPATRAARRGARSKVVRRQRSDVGRALSGACPAQAAYAVNRGDRPDPLDPAWTTVRRPGRSPTQPGVYRFRDAHGRVIYVGKAKSLRSRLNSYFADPDRPAPAHPQMVTTAAKRRLDRGPDRGRGAPAGVLLDQGVRPAVQRQVPRRQVLPLPRGHPDEEFPRVMVGARRQAQGHPLLRPLLPRLGHPRDRRPAAAGLPDAPCRPGVFKRPRAARPARACSATSASARRRASAGSAPRSTARSSTTSATSWPATPTPMIKRLEREMNAASDATGVRAGRPAARRHRRPAAGHGEAGRRLRATAPTPT